MNCGKLIPFSSKLDGRMPDPMGQARITKDVKQHEKEKYQ